jgi:hypothetical protein
MEASPKLELVFPVTSASCVDGEIHDNIEPLDTFSMAKTKVAAAAIKSMIAKSVLPEKRSVVLRSIAIPLYKKRSVKTCGLSWK